MKNIVIGTSALLVTFRCNLRCKLCCTNTPYREISEQCDFPLVKLQNCVSKYFEVVSFIRKFSLGGGEPTLYREFSSLVDHIMQFKNQFEILEVITNGAADLRKDVYDSIEKNKERMFITIDNYGPDISRNVENIASAFDQRNIKYQIRDYNAQKAHCGGWVDLGDFTYKNDKEKADELFRSCTISNKIKDNTVVVKGFDGYIKDCFFINYAANTMGKIHHCARAYSTLESGAVKDIPQNFVNILDSNKNTEQIRQEIIDMWSVDTYEPCRYCNGFDDTSKRYVPAEQI